MKKTELENKRTELTDTVDMSYSPDDFPGSTEWVRTQNLQKKVCEFDLEHPEIIAEIKAAKKSKDAAIAKKAGWV